MSKKILIKLSGEALEDSKNHNIFNPKVLKSIADQINYLVQKDYQIGIVIGGGNIWRGKLFNNLQINEESAHYMGMLSTVINSIALTNFLRTNYQLKAVNLINSLEVNIPNHYIKYNGKSIAKYFQPNVVNVFAGGTGKPFFSTDTSVAQKAIAAGADLVLIAKFGTDGVYDKDPNLYKDAKFIQNISFKECLKNNKINVMDNEALKLLENKKIKLYIFDMNKKDSIIKVLETKEFKKTIIEN